MTIEELDLSVRVYNVLKRADINFVEELEILSDEDLLKIRNISQKGLIEIKEELSKLNKKQENSISIEKEVENLLMNYMDEPVSFDYGYIPDLFDVRPLRDDIVNLIKKIVNGGQIK